MSGVKIHTDDPISSAPNPQTDPPPRATGGVPPSNVPATTTATSTPAYPAAQPGARPPAPTGAPMPTSSPYVPQPNPTQTYTPSTASSYGPPPPQPGAAPSPRPSPSAAGSSLPPPPKVGEKVQPASYYQQSARPTPAPGTQVGTSPSSGLPPTSYGELQQPLRAQPPAGSTSTYAPLGTTRPGQSQGRRSFNHPPGYQQDPYAGDRMPYTNATPQSAMGGSEEKQGGILGGLSETISNYTSGNSSGGGGGLGGGMFSGTASRGDSGEGIMNAVGAWAKGVGQKAAEIEGEVWKRVNGEK